MKNVTKPYRHFIGSTILLLLLGGCTIPVVHEYASGSPGGSSDYFEKIISTQDLGVGYDLVYTDPEDWAHNSVQGRTVRPKVFLFEPNPNPNLFIDIPQLEGTPNCRLLPKGVFAETNSRFQWSDKLDFVYSASDMMRSYGGSFSASVGAPVASFSMSASYEETKAATSVDQTSIAYKKGAFRGHVLQLDPGYTHQLSPEFRKAITELNPDNAPNFIEQWGTHYTNSATIGARCAYRLEHTVKERSSLASNETSFEAEVTGGTGTLEVGVGAGYSQSSMESAQNATGAKSIEFVSYGGSGAGMDDFALWTKHAVNNPTLVDVYLEPYTTLLNDQYFPELPNLEMTRNTLEQAIAGYFTMHAVDTSRVKPTFEPGADAEYEVRVMYLRHSMRTGSQTDVTYWGQMYVKPYDRDNQEYGCIVGYQKDNKDGYSMETPFWNAPRWGGEGIEKWGNDVRWQPNQPTQNANVIYYPWSDSGIPESYKFKVNFKDIATSYVAVTGETEEYWKGHSAPITKLDKDNRITFAEVEDVPMGQEVIKTVDFVMDDDMTQVPVITVEFRVKRIE